VNDWLDSLPDWARELLHGSRVARLGLLDDRDHPRVLPVTFALHRGRIWTAIDSKPKRTDKPPSRVGYLRRRPQVAFTVDRYSDDWEKLAWVQLLGDTRLIAAEQGSAAIEALARRYPQYRAAPPPGPLLAIEVRRCLHWRA
jgi:PPOX class probable F420-dependent enzyme